MTCPVVLSVAGSDSGGGAGIQADIRAIAACGGFATTAITAVTAQNLDGVYDVHGIPAEKLKAQLTAVVKGFPVRAAKTGMLWSTELIRVVASCLRETAFPWVIDPVMVATSGDLLLQRDSVQAYLDDLLPHATVITPNLDEAAVILGVDSITDEAHRDAAVELARRLSTDVLLKGGHRRGDIVDVLVAAEKVHEFPGKRYELNTHGSGCTLSAALATYLAHGMPLVGAVEAALAYVQRAAAIPLQLSGASAHLLNLGLSTWEDAPGAIAAPALLGA